jgi:hypothetical protein
MPLFKTSSEHQFTAVPPLSQPINISGVLATLRARQRRQAAARRPEAHSTAAGSSSSSGDGSGDDEDDGELGDRGCYVS